MTGPFFHGTTHRRFRPGEMIVPGRDVGQWSNWTVFEKMLRRPLVSGRTVDTRDVVWITPDADAAWGWAYHSTLKATPAEIRGMPAGGAGVYEVEPVGLDYPVDPHGQGEACCATARVIREVSFEAFPQDGCDNCGQPATVLGSDEQFCDECAADRETVS